MEASILGIGRHRRPPVRRVFEKIVVPSTRGDKIPTGPRVLDIEGDALGATAQKNQVSVETRARAIVYNSRESPPSPPTCLESGGGPLISGSPRPEERYIYEHGRV
jgi:hypothetical protein